jgi:CubicO group peptidase (beta-lactamase class C family)
VKSALAGTLTAVTLAAGTGCENVAPRDGKLRTIAGSVTTVRNFERDVTSSMEKAGVTGLAVAIVNDSQIVYTRQFGWKDKDAGTRLHDTTVFAGASLSKPVFAYVVSVLAENGVLDLDKPLHLYLRKPLPGHSGYEDIAEDRRYEAITARMTLSHTTGLPNLRSLTAEGRLRIAFDPGSRFSYSGEGVQLLQMVIEQITRTDLETLAREHVFVPFGMRRTSFLWRSSFAGDVASPHNEFEWATEPNRPMSASAAGSLTTTAGDYARFVSGILRARGRRRETVDAMLAPVVHITSQRMFGPGSRVETTANEAMRLSWALGWGAFHTAYGWALFHTGHASGAQNYVVVYPEQGIGMVLLSNSDNFQLVARDIVAAGIGDTLSPFRWLGFMPFDSTRRRPAPPRRVAIVVGPSLVASYAGTYRLGSGIAQTYLRADGARLFASDDGLSWDELFAESDSVFFFRGRNVTLTFVKDAKGEVSRINIDADGTKIIARRIR